MTAHGSRCVPINSAQGPHRGRRRGGEGVLPAASLALPPCAELPRCQPGRQLSTSPRRGETPDFGGRTPAVPPPSLPENSSPRCTSRSTNQIPTVTKTVGVGRGGLGDAEEVSPTLPHACFPLLTSPHTRLGPASASCRHRDPHPGIRRLTRPAAASSPAPPPTLDYSQRHMTWRQWARRWVIRRSPRRACAPRV